MVVLGYPSAKARTLKTASLLDAGFASGSGSTPIATLAAAPGPAPNMRPRVCGAHRAQVAEDDFAVVPVAQRPGESDHNSIFFGATGAGAPVNGLAATQEQMHTRPSFEPVDVYVGRAPGWTGPVLAARGDGPRPDASAAAQPGAKTTVAKAKGKHLAKGKKAAKKKPAPKAKVEAKPSPPARPKTAQH